jgi:alpha-tubulin suppressor-like RCC1 family protein
VYGGHSWSQIFANSTGGNFGGIEASTGILYTWGAGNLELGTYSNLNASTPTSVLFLTGYRSFTQLVSGNIQDASPAVLVLEGSSGSAYAWGRNTLGTLGTGSATSIDSPVSVLGGRSWSMLAIDSVSDDADHACAIEASTGNAYCWGNNTLGELGTNTIINASSPVSVVGGRSYSQIFVDNQTSYALEASTGNIYSWGSGTQGQLSNGIITNESSPVALSGNRSFVSMVIAGNNSNEPANFAIEGSTGNLWAWGYNAAGYLGIGSVGPTATSSPLSVFGGRSYSSVTSGGGSGYVVAIEASTGNAYAWGTVTGGRLGNNRDIYSNSPLSIAGIQNY